MDFFFLLRGGSSSIPSICSCSSPSRKLYNQLKPMSQKVGPPLCSAFILTHYDAFFNDKQNEKQILELMFQVEVVTLKHKHHPTSPISRRCYVRHKSGHFLYKRCPLIGCIDQTRDKKWLHPLLSVHSKATWSMPLFPWGAKQECVPMQMWRQEEELRCGCEPSACSSAALLQSTQRLSCQHESLSSGWNIQWLLQKYLQQLPDVSRHLHPGKKHLACPAYPPNSHRPLTIMKYAQRSSSYEEESDALTDIDKHANFKDANFDE